MKFIRESWKSKYVDAGLVLISLVLLFVFGPSFGAVFCCGASLVVIVLRKIDFRKHFILKRLLIAGFILIGISFVTVEAFVASEFGANDSQIRDADAVVVLGAGLRGSKLTKTLTQRLEASLEYLNLNKEIPIIVSGGRGPGEDLPEAEAMQDYLISKGIPKERILLENKSTSTKENLLFSKAILTAKGLNNPKILLVTSDYHMFRAKLLAKRTGFETAAIASKSPTLSEAKLYDERVLCGN